MSRPQSALLDLQFEVVISLDAQKPRARGPNTSLCLPRGKDRNREETETTRQTRVPLHFVLFIRGLRSCICVYLRLGRDSAAAARDKAARGRATARGSAATRDMSSAAAHVALGDIDSRTVGSPAAGGTPVRGMKRLNAKKLGYALTIKELFP